MAANLQNGADQQPAIKRWFQAPGRRYFLTLSLLSVLTVASPLIAFVLPGWLTAICAFIGAAAWIAMGAYWLSSAIIAVIGNSPRHRPGTAHRWVLSAVVVIITIIGATFVDYIIDLRMRFAYSQPELDQLAQKVMAAPLGPYTTSHLRVGKFDAYDAQHTPRGMRFHSDVQLDLFKRQGLAYCVTPPPPFDYTERIEYVPYSGHWYRFQEFGVEPPTTTPTNPPNP